jgi:hypothetical protein
MLWGTVPSVPAVGVWMLLLLAAGFTLFGVRRLGARPRTMGLAALLLALAIPLTARALTLPFTFTNGTIADASQVNANFAALASGKVYGFVNANGTLDQGINGGIVDVNSPGAGFYCIKLGAPAKSFVASIDPTTIGGVAIVMTFVPHAGAIGLSGCPAGFNDAAAVVKNGSGAQVAAGFYAVFQ